MKHGLDTTLQHGKSNVTPFQFCIVCYYQTVKTDIGCSAQNNKKKTNFLLNFKVQIEFMQLEELARA